MLSLPVSRLLYVCKAEWLLGSIDGQHVGRWCAVTYRLFYFFDSLPLEIIFLLSTTKLRQGNVFTPVCHSVHRGVSAPVHAGIHALLGRHPSPGQSPLPWADTPSPGGHCSGRYASYLNAFLLDKNFDFKKNHDRRNFASC